MRVRESPYRVIHALRPVERGVTAADCSHYSDRRRPEVVDATMRILTYSGYSSQGMQQVMGFLDFFRGSPSERIARQFIKALRQAGVTHRLEYEPDENQIGFYDASGSRVRVSFLGNLRRELEAAGA